jgi:hypothetical protein
MSAVTAISEKHDLLAVHLPARDSKRFIIKCFDSKVSLGSLKYTLSAKDTNVKSESSMDLKIDMRIDSMVFSSNHLLACIPSANAILVFDLSRGVLSYTIHIPSNMGNLISCTANKSTDKEYCYSLVRKDGKTLVLVYDLKHEKEAKIVKKIKAGSCDEDDILAFAVHPSDGNIAVRIGKKVKLINSTDGSVSSKFKIKSAASDSSSMNMPAFVHFTPDGNVLVTNSSNSVHYFSTNSGEIISNSPIRVNKICSRAFDSSRYVFSSTDGQSVSLLLLDPSNASKKKAIKPFTSGSIPNDIQNGYLEGFFSDHELVMQQIIATGFSNVDVRMSRVAYRNDDNKDAVIEGGDLYKSAFKGDDEDRELAVTTASSSSKKRKSNIVLGAGESGGEAMSVSDLKRAKAKHGEDEIEEVEDFVLENDDGGTTIAQRLALLSSELERDTEDEEDLIQRSSSPSSTFEVKAATADSLVILLRQALLANDDAQLEVALQVADKKVIENSIKALSNLTSGGEDVEDESNGNDGEIMITLLTKLVTRISRKPSRAQQLSFWIRTVLVALLSSNNGKMDRSEREIASKLAPLRNMLSERVESLPAMLRLEGRLNLLGKL